jgi:hypothetical protein
MAIKYNKVNIVSSSRRKERRKCYQLSNQMVQMVYVQRKGQKEANHDHKDMYEPLAEKKGIRPRAARRWMCGQDGCWSKRPAHAHIKSGKDTKTPSALNNLRKKDKISVEKRRLFEMG